MRSLHPQNQHRVVFPLCHPYPPPYNCSPDITLFPTFQDSRDQTFHTMSPFNLTGDILLPLIRQIHNGTLPGPAAVGARDTVVADLSSPSARHVTIGAITVLGIFFTCLFVYCMCRTGGKAAGVPDLEADPALAPGHVYGHNNESTSYVLGTLRSDRRSGRPSFQHVEDRASGNRYTGGSTVARPAPAVTRHSDVDDETPPPPCK